MIEAVDLVKTYHDGEKTVKPLNHVHFSCLKGEFILIVGRSGTGKTTLLNTIGGLTKPDNGTVRINGHDILALSDLENARLRSRTIGFVFQFPGLLSPLTTLENVILPSHIAGNHVPEERGRELLKMVGLSDKLENYPSQLSGGQLKRTAIARALINDPDLILADEPTADLDDETEKEIMDLLVSINKAGTTILLVTHSMDLASYADRVFRMHNGEIYEVDRSVSSSSPETSPSPHGIKNQPIFSL